MVGSNANKYNKNGDEMCHAFGCRKHKRLQYIFRGLFCKEHCELLSNIRYNLYISKLTKNIIRENYWRQKEIELRKFLDSGHMIYKRHVENSIESLN